MGLSAIKPFSHAIFPRFNCRSFCRTIPINYRTCVQKGIALDFLKSLDDTSIVSKCIERLQSVLACYAWLKRGHLLYLLKICVLYTLPFSQQIRIQFTSPVVVAKIRKSPDISKTHGVPDAGEQKV